MDKFIITETIKSHLTPNFHVTVDDEMPKSIDILTPNKTLGAKIIINSDVLSKPENLDTIGRMLAQSFMNKAWEIL